MTTQIIIVAAITIFEALLAFIVYLHDPKSESNRLFSLYIFSVIVWTIGNFLADFLHSFFWTNVTYLGAIGIFYFFLRLTEIFPTSLYPIRNSLKKIFLALTIFLSVSLFLPGGLIVSRIESYGSGINVVTGPLFPLVTTFFLVTFLYSIVLLVLKLRKTSGLERLQVQYLTIGFALSFGVGILANLIIPLVTGSYASSQYGPYGLIFLIVLSTFAIIRFNLFNITIIATEIFASLLVLILLAQAFLATSTLQIIGSYAVLLLAVVLSFFLIRSMLREVKQKEELGRLSKRLEETNQELKRLDETKSEFVSIASHQLRTPLTVIKGYISMLEEESFGKIPVKQQGPLDKVYESANRLIELVENLLSVSRIESGRMKYNFEAVKLADMAASVVDELTGAAKKKNLHLEFIMPKTALPEINIDKDKIRQVMMNLVDNAVKYTKRGTVIVSLRQESGQSGGHVAVPSLVFEVKDTGNGVRPDDIDRLFQKFIRGQGSSLVHTEGTGLGLYVGRMMVEAHGGNIWVESRGEGLGSTFAFSLPLTRPGQVSPHLANFESLVKHL